SFFYHTLISEGHSLAEVEDEGLALGAELGCPTAEHPSMLECMRTLDARDVAELFASWDNGAPVTLDGPDGVLPAPAIELLPATPANRAPLGQARGEAGGMATDPIFREPFSHGFYTQLTNDLLGTGEVAQVRRYYTADIYGSWRWAWFMMETDVNNA